MIRCSSRSLLEATSRFLPLICGYRRVGSLNQLEPTWIDLHEIFPFWGEGVLKEDCQKRCQVPHRYLLVPQRAELLALPGSYQLVSEYFGKCTCLIHTSNLVLSMHHTCVYMLYEFIQKLCASNTGDFPMNNDYSWLVGTCIKVHSWHQNWSQENSRLGPWRDTTTADGGPTQFPTRLLKPQRQFHRAHAASRRECQAWLLTRVYQDFITMDFITVRIINGFYKDYKDYKWIINGFVKSEPWLAILLITLALQG